MHVLHKTRLDNFRYLKCKSEQNLCSLTGEDGCPTATIKAEYKGELTIGSSANCTLELTDIPKYSLLILKPTTNLEKNDGSRSDNRDCGDISFDGKRENINKNNKTLTNYYALNINTAVIEILPECDQEYSVTLEYTGK